MVLEPDDITFGAWLDVYIVDNGTAHDVVDLLQQQTCASHLHAVNADGIGGSSSRTAGDTSLEDIKDILDEVMDGETYALWLKNRVPFYGYDLEHLVSQFHADEGEVRCSFMEHSRHDGPLCHLEHSLVWVIISWFTTDAFFARWFPVLAKVAKSKRTTTRGRTWLLVCIPVSCILPGCCLLSFAHNDTYHEAMWPWLAGMILDYAWFSCLPTVRFRISGEAELRPSWQVILLS